MRTNCDLELRLVTPSVNSAFNALNHSMHTMEDGVIAVNHQEDKQQLTVFYNGTMASCDDLTELQARAIISLASNQQSNRSSPVITNYSSIYSPKSNALSMKKSLQRFLEKRKARRAQATSPYFITRQNKPY